MYMDKLNHEDSYFKYINNITKSYPNIHQKHKEFLSTLFNRK